MKEYYNKLKEGADNVTNGNIGSTNVPRKAENKTKKKKFCNTSEENTNNYC